MSAATATAPRARQQAPAWTRHTPDELTFSRQAGDLHTFTAPSARTPGRVNTVTYDSTTREAECDCQHTPRQKRDGTVSVCWHAHHAAAHRDGRQRPPRGRVVVRPGPAIGRRGRRGRCR